MTIIPLEIPDEIYSNKLLQLLLGKRFDETFNQQLLTIIHKLCLNNFLQNQEKKNVIIFDDEENEFIFDTEITSICCNKEIIARWCDYSQSLSKKKRSENARLSCFNYLEVFKQTNNYEYFIRRLQIICSKKNLFTIELNSYFDFIKEVLLKCESAYRQKQIFEELIIIYSQQKCIDEFEPFLLKQEELLVQKEDFDGSRFIIQSLSIIGAIKKNQLKIRIAENYEQQGDLYTNKSGQNIFYSNTAEIYLKGLRELKDAYNCKDIKSRIEKKVLEEQKKFVDFLNIYGIRTNYPIDIDELQKEISKLGINNFESAFNTLRFNLPLTPLSKINSYVEQGKKSGFILEFIANTHKLNNKGNIVGNSVGEQSVINNGRNYYRERNIALITTLKYIVDINKEVDENWVLNLLDFTKSKFIPEDRIEIYARGIYEGFQNNFTISSHILVPQIENSIRHIANQNSISTTRTDDDLQYENTLGGCLERIKEIIDPDLLSELKNFLVDTSNVNFRNEISHGLMSPFLIQHYGKYLWWLSLKMIFQTDKYFILDSTN